MEMETVIVVEMETNNNKVTKPAIWPVLFCQTILCEKNTKIRVNI